MHPLRSTARYKYPTVDVPTVLHVNTPPCFLSCAPTSLRIGVSCGVRTLQQKYCFEVRVVALFFFHGAAVLSILYCAVLCTVVLLYCLVRASIRKYWFRVCVWPLYGGKMRCNGCSLSFGVPSCQICLATWPCWPRRWVIRARDPVRKWGVGNHAGGRPSACGMLFAARRGRCGLSLVPIFSHAINSASRR